LTAIYCYAHEDQSLCEQLEQHLINLKRLYHLRTWFDSQILPGEDRKKIFEYKLQTADLILLLISPDFMTYDDYDQYLSLILTRYHKGEARVIPVYLRPIHWKDAPFSGIQVLPNDTQPVVLWENRDEAFYDIALGIEKVIKDLLLVRQSQEILKKNREDVSSNVHPFAAALDTQRRTLDPILNDMVVSINRGNMFHKQGKYQEAIHAYMQVIEANFDSVMKHSYKGDAWVDLRKAEETLALDLRSSVAYRDKVSALLELQRYEEALQTCEAFMKPGFYVIAVDYNNKAYALARLKRYAEALQACEQAIRLKPGLVAAYKNKAIALHGLTLYEEALQTCSQAISLKPDFSAIYALLGIALFHLKRDQESCAAFVRWSELLYET
jgi:tetratricopeptide (TPR) repeat protein